MGTITFMYWNIENFGVGTNSKGQPATKGKFTLTGPEMVQCIAKVALDLGASIVGLNEIRSGLGATLGPAIATALGASWQSAYSPKFGARHEEYIFLWNTNKVTTYAAFQHQFPDPARPGKLLGFPLQAKSDRPPFLGYFQTTNGKRLAVAIFHGPGPDYWNGVRDGNKNLGSVTAFQTAGDTCLVLGDCNIKWDADVNVASSRGYLAFTPLVALGFEQNILQPMLTSLKSYRSAWPTMIIQDAYSEPYDQIFMRTAVGYGCEEPGREELLIECENSRYLSNTLKDIQAKWEGARPALYNSVAETFVPFRRYVSDHMPVVGSVTYP